MRPSRPSLTAAILARNEERMLADCVRSVEFADERLVLVDAATRDRTREIARQLGARVEERVFVNFAAQRDLALSLRRHGGGRPGAKLGLTLRAARLLGARRLLDLMLRFGPHKLSLR